jgi:hypothetical protein
MLILKVYPLNRFAKMYNLVEDDTFLGFSRVLGVKNLSIINFAMECKLPSMRFLQLPQKIGHGRFEIGLR